MSTLLQDLRQSVRQLLRKPLFTATAVLTLAMGMGVNVVAFSVVNGMLFKGFALNGLPGAGRIMTTPGGDEEGNASMAEFEQFREATAGSLDIAAEGRSAVAWKHEQGTETAWVLYVSPGYFSIVDAPVIAGRLVVERGAGTTSVVIGERFWREKLGTPSIAGLTLRLNNTEVAVAGVVAGSFTGPAGIYSPDIWLPLTGLDLLSPSPLLRQRDTRWLFVLGRLRAGATAAQVEGQVQAAAEAMTRDWADTHQDRGARFRMFGDRNAERRGIATAAAIGMGVIGLVLLIACFNVANLLLARAVERQRDMGIRAAMGAKPSRLVRLVVTEGFLLASLSGIAALLLASWTQTLVSSFAMPIDSPQHIDLTPDRNVALFAGALIVLAGVLPGLWPALSTARIDVLRVLGSQGGYVTGARPSALRRWLVGAQVVGSTMFLTVGGLFLQSYTVLTTFDVGFARDRLVLADFDPSANGLDASRSEPYVSALVDRVRALPGVTDVAVIDRAPFFIGYDRTTVVEPTGRPFPTYAVSAGYFRTMGIAISQGREFDRDNSPGQVIVNDRMAEMLFGDRDAPGQTIRVGEAGDPFTIIGVVSKTRTRGLDRETPVLFVPLTPAHYERSVTVVARSIAPPATLVRPITDIAQAIDPSVALVSVKTMEQRMAVQLWPFRTLTRLFTICGLTALLLATVGLAGVVIHAVNRRVREFGVRLSVGAAPRDLMRNVLQGGMAMLVPGLAVGLLLAAAVARMIQSVFVGVDVLHPVTYVVVAIVETMIVAIACLGPALRAARVDPLTALRAE
jgi:predicted permease